MSRRAVFLDRDGTLIDDPGYLRDPRDVRLLPGVADALRTLERAGVARVVVTNQSGIGRAMLSTADYVRVRTEVDRQLAEAGATVDLTLHCPHLPDAGCLCRKPGTALHREAAARLDLDLATSWCIGDRPGDLLPARALGGRAILVRTGDGAQHVEAARALGAPVVDALGAAVALLLAEEGA